MASSVTLVTCAVWLEISPIELASSCTAAATVLMFMVVVLRSATAVVIWSRVELALVVTVEVELRMTCALCISRVAMVATEPRTSSAMPPSASRCVRRIASARSALLAEVSSPIVWSRNLPMARATSPISSRLSACGTGALMSPSVSSPTPATSPRIARMIERDSDQANSSASSVAASVTASALHSLVLKPSMRTMSSRSSSFAAVPQNCSEASSTASFSRFRLARSSLARSSPRSTTAAALIAAR